MNEEEKTNNSSITNKELLKGFGFKYSQDNEPSEITLQKEEYNPHHVVLFGVLETLTGKWFEESNTHYFLDVSGYTGVESYEQFIASFMTGYQKRIEEDSDEQ